MLLNKVGLNLAALASKEVSRYTLNGLAVRPKDVAVTNGHYAITVSHQAMPETSFPETAGLEHKHLVNGLVNETVMLTREAALGAAKAIPKRVTLPCLGFAALGTDNTLYVNQLDSVQTFKGKLEGTFPNLEQVMPIGKPVAEVCLSAEYIEMIAKYMRSASDRSVAVRLTIYDNGRPVRFDARTPDGQNIMAVLMPMRQSAADFATRPDQIASTESDSVVSTPEEVVVAE